MAMNVGPASEDGEDQLNNTINTTPLVDVMLVLLIIFLITVPVVATSIPVQLPKQRNEVRDTTLENVTVSVDAQGRIYWNDLRLGNTAALLDRLKRIAQQSPQPEVHIRGDANASYEAVGRILLACQRAGITRVSFVMEPPPRGG